MKKIKKIFKSKRGEGYVETGVKILISVVLGALMLSSLYALFKTTVMPSVTSKIESMFAYSGSWGGASENLPEIEVISGTNVIKQGFPYSLEFSHDAGIVKNAYFDGEEIVKDKDYSSFTMGKEDGNIVFILADSFIDSIPTGEHSIEVITENGAIHRTATKG